MVGGRGGAGRETPWGGGICAWGGAGGFCRNNSLGDKIKGRLKAEWGRLGELECKDCLAACAGLGL